MNFHYIYDELDVYFITRIIFPNKRYIFYYFSFLRVNFNYMDLSFVHRNPPKFGLSIY